MVTLILTYRVAAPGSTTASLASTWSSAQTTISRTSTSGCSEEWAAEGTGIFKDSSEIWKRSDKQWQKQLLNHKDVQLTICSYFKLLVLSLGLRLKRRNSWRKKSTNFSCFWNDRGPSRSPIPPISIRWRRKKETSFQLRHRCRPIFMSFVP